MENAATTSFKLNQFEYCYLVEDTDPCATTMKIYVPKLQAQQTGSAEPIEQPINDSSFLNTEESKLQNSNNVTKANYITARVTLPLAHRHDFHDCEGCPCPNAEHNLSTCHPGTGYLVLCEHYHHDHHFPHVGEKGKIPAGTKMICMFMNDNPADCYVTRMLCDMPGGTKMELPRERYR